MKNKNYRNFLGLAVVSAALAGNTAIAGTEITTPPASIEAPEADLVSGTLGLNANTHFISYGADVWQDGTDFGNFGFYPSLELAFALPNDLTLTLGTWSEVNKKGASKIGGAIQEIDVWTGLSYTHDKFTVGATYQQWIFGGGTEQILDVSVAYDTFLSPKLTFHNRLDPGASGGQEGTIAVLGVSHGVEAGPVSVSFPVNLAYFFNDDFHKSSSESGFGYLSVGVTASLPLAPYIGKGYGEWDLHAGLDYFMTDTRVVNNGNNNFLTANIGLGLSF